MSSNKPCRTLAAPEPRRHLRILEAAEYMNTTPWQVRTLIWKQAIPVIPIGKRHVLDQRDLDLYMQSQKTEVAWEQRERTEEPNG